jgi:uncharacterized phage-associated protein
MNTAHEISDWILSKIDIEAGDSISPLKLQKILYYCQAWHLTIFKKPVFDERIEAWAKGPVVPSQYKRFAETPIYDSIRITNIELHIPKLDKNTEELLIEVINLYGERSASYLENLTHSENPWIEARGNLEPHRKSSAEISHKSMIDFYSTFKKHGK